MKHFKSSIVFTIVCLVLAAAWGFHSGSAEAAMKDILIALILGVLEVSLSFDNAVVNASTLEEMDEIWRHRFLTWGMIIAVFGMRLVFPIVIVSIIAWLNPFEVISMALTKPDKYAEYLTSSHEMISSFGGMFLLMVFFKYILDPEKELHWIEPLEKVLVKIGKIESFEIFLSLAVLLGAQAIAEPTHKLSILISGIAGLMTFMLVDGVSSLMENAEEGKHSTNVGDVVKKGGLATFLYLELLDASFSFDGVIGAFAISNDIIIIATGLAIGAMFVRSLTLFLVDKGTLAEYIFLEHGAHYAIGVLAFIMMLSVKFHISEVFTGLSGVFFIGISVWSSILHRKKEELKS
ncbi:MAG: DUF475 domain-containing protein [Candidatus Sericytochromatia bacterium]